MFAVVISFLKTHWQTALIASLIISVAAAFTLQRFEIRHLRGELSECRGENVTLEASNRALLGSLADQNAAIALLKAAARRKSEATLRALSAAKAQAGWHFSRAEQIRSQPMPQDECASLKMLVNGFVAPAHQQ